MSLIPGTVLTPVADREAMLSEPHLILSVDKLLDRVVIIPIAPKQSKGRTYFRSYKVVSYQELDAELDLGNPRLATSAFKPRAVTCGTDEDIDARFAAGKSGGSSTARKLKRRWSLIEGLVCGPEKELLFYEEHLPELVRKHAAMIASHPQFNELYASKCRTRPRASKKDPGQKRLERIETEIRQLLNQYWAGGSFRGALTPLAEKHGNPGERRKAGALKRGHPNLAGRNGAKESGGPAGINVTPGSTHAAIIQFCWDTHVVRGKTSGYARRMMYNEFYSTTVVQPDGSTSKEWVPAHQRPTASHFEYWGAQRDPSAAAWRRQLPQGAYEKLFRAIQGAVTDDVYSVGQRGAMDSTPPDIQLVSALNRLDRIGGAHRIIVADTLGEGYIPGFYLGFDAASAETVKLAAYTAQMGTEEWREWLELLGLDTEIAAEDFIPITFSNLWADNTDLRSDEIMECLHAVETNIHYIPTRRSDMNSRVEADHRGLHALADHKRPGTTFGKKTERGEQAAVFRARMTMMEVIRDNVRAHHRWNTMPLDKALPLGMKGVEPTRLAITRELIRTGRIARPALPPELAIRVLLPKIAGTFTESGVRLHMLTSGQQKTYIGRVIFTSKHPLIEQWCSLARQGGRRDPGFFEHMFTINPMIPTRIWFTDPKTQELIRLNQRALGMRDPDLPYETTLGDLVQLTRADNDSRPARRDATDRSIGVFEAKQRDDQDRSEAAYAQAVKAAGSEPTRAQMKTNLRSNRERERAFTVVVAGMPIAPALTAAPGMSAPAADIGAESPGNADSSCIAPAERSFQDVSAGASTSDHSASIAPTSAKNSAGSASVSKGLPTLLVEALREADQLSHEGDRS